MTRKRHKATTNRNTIDTKREKKQFQRRLKEYKDVQNENEEWQNAIMR